MPFLNFTLIFRTFIILIIISISFVLGFLVANRERVNSLENKISTRSANGYANNTLSDIEQKNVEGAFGNLEGLNNQVYGEVFLKATKNNKTELLLNLRNIPEYIFSKKNENETRETPREYKLKLAKLCCGKQNYEYIDTDVTIVVDTVNNTRSTQSFSTILDYNLLDGTFDRIIFESEIKNFYYIDKDTKKNWPLETLKEPAKFLWINLTTFR